MVGVFLCGGSVAIRVYTSYTRPVLSWHVGHHRELYVAKVVRSKLVMLDYCSAEHRPIMRR